jgi:hypothetical protein
MNRTGFQDKEKTMTRKIVQVSAEQGWGLRSERVIHSVFIEVDSFPDDRAQGATLAWAYLLSRKDDPKIKRVLDHTIRPHASYTYPPNLTATVINPIDFTDNA